MPDPGDEGTDMMAEASIMTTELAADVTQVVVARRFVRSQLGDDVAPSVCADAQLIASELVTNAVEHGTGDTVVVSVVCRNGAVQITVESVGPSPGVGDIADWTVAPVDRVDGRGLGIVRSVADRVEMVRDGGRLVITAALAP